MEKTLDEIRGAEAAEDKAAEAETATKQAEQEATKPEGQPAPGDDEKSAGKDQEQQTKQPAPEEEKPGIGEKPKDDQTSSRDEAEGAADDADVPEPVRKKFGDLTKKWRSTERERDFYRQQAEYYEKIAMAQMPKTTPEKQDQKAESEKPVIPNRADFDDYEQYVDALNSYHEKMVDYKVSKKLEEQRSAEKAQKMAQKLSALKTEGEKTYNDFESVVRPVYMPGWLLTFAAERENGHALVYQLAKDPEMLNKISTASPQQAGYLIAQFESSHAPKPQSQTPTPPNPGSKIKPVAAGPKPIEPIKGSGATPGFDRSYDDDENLPYADWKRRHEASLKKKG